MKVQSLRLKNVKRFTDQTVNFCDELTGKVRSRTVIVGKNGAGKTTLLETIYKIIFLMEAGELGLNSVKLDFFRPGGTELKLQIPIEQKVENIVVRTGSLYETDHDFYMGMKLQIMPDDLPLPEFYQSPLGTKVLGQIHDAVAGITEDVKIGNLLYFPTDRMVHFGARGQLVNERPDFNWAYRYNRSHTEWKGSLESYLGWMYFRDLKVREQNPDAPSKFEEFKNVVNAFLEGKRITTVDLKYRVEVEVEGSNNKLGLDALSSGEIQVVLLVGEIFRHIRKGSIIMIDEPELHLHPVWQRIFVEVLTSFCKKYDAQMILTTQSPRIAEAMLEHEVISLDELLEES